MALPVSIIQIVLIVAVVFCIIELGLTAYVASGYWWHSPDVVNFMVFNSVWSLLVLAYIGLTPIFMARLFHQFVSLGLLTVTTIFWFAGAIALAAWIGTPNCGASNWCGSAQAACAFGFFIWAIFTGLLVLDVLAVLRSRGHSSTNTKPAHGSNNGPYPGA